MSCANSLRGSLAGNSERSFTLHWTARAGEHSYTAKLYRLVNGQKQWADLWSGKIRVRRPDQQFAVELEAFPRDLEGGGMVFFTVGAWNFAGDALNVQFHVVDESGRVVYPRDGGWISKYLPKGASNYTLDAFNWDIYGVDNHTYTVIARISGEEENDTATIIVKPVNGTGLKQVGFECDDLYLSTGLDRGHHLLYRGTLTCRAILYNPTPYYLRGSITDVHAVEITPKVLDSDLVGEWGYTPTISIAPNGYYTVLFYRNTTSIGVYHLEHDLYGLPFTVKLHYEFNSTNGLFSEKFIGIGSAWITQDSTQAAISSTIFIGGTAATIVGFFVSTPALTAMGALSFFVGLYQTAG